MVQKKMGAGSLARNLMVLVFGDLAQPRDTLAETACEALDFRLFFLRP